MPGVQVGVWMCRRCLRANSWPYGVVVAQQAILGVGEGNGSWQQLIADTLADQNVDRALFDEDVGRTWLHLNDGRS